MTTTADSRTVTTDKVAAAHDTLIALVNDLQSGQDWKAALDTVARFHRYSFANCLLIAASHARAYAEGRVPDPQPDVVAGYRTWQAWAGRSSAGNGVTRSWDREVRSQLVPRDPGQSAAFAAHARPAYAVAGYSRRSLRWARVQQEVSHEPWYLEFGFGAEVGSASGRADRASDHAPESAVNLGLLEQRPATSTPPATGTPSPSRPPPRG